MENCVFAQPDTDYQILQGRRRPHVFSVPVAFRDSVFLHRAPVPEEEPLPGEDPEPEEDPVPHPDPVVREPDEAPPLGLRQRIPMVPFSSEIS